ncbi:MAG: Inner membrane protein oxaA [Berkelbacteria bacterium GW2011_GWA2_38_9]|uniref:Inner membrane protein oxaA n=1 Tax=Berkelbacteria bacterium GW2011_GWA2_38_9 TaxID=1618334 RepID=A0A0G0L5B4_9BACT|nr:MAG: Inner membrane protein oxaA [Berkelbacteria bacterium GW2011_GWA2_38_9]
MKEIIRQVLYIPLVNLLIFLIWLIPGHSAGAAIIILTVLIRFILIIPSRKATQSQLKMREIQPKVDEIRRLYPDDRQKQSLEMMELYKRENVNMFGSCLPMLIQLPVLLGLYYAFSNGLDPSRVSLVYDFVPRAAVIDKTFFGIDLTKPDHTYILPILAGVIQFIQTKMMTPKRTKDNKTDPSVAMQQNMVYMFPILTIMISRSFAAALPLYWAVSSIFSTVQQYAIMKRSQQAHKNQPAAVETRHGVSQIEERSDNIRPIKEGTQTKHGVELTVRRKG